MTLPKLAIFDMDGVIFDTERLFMETRAVVMKKYGYEHREEDYIRTLGTSGEELRSILLELYGPEYPMDQITKETREALSEAISKNGPPVKKGIRELLNYFGEKEVPCCIASSSPKEVIKEYLLHSGLTPFFEFIVSGDDVSRSKPDPEIFNYACEEAMITPNRALVLEDSPNGIAAAWAARIPTICIPDLVTPSIDDARRTFGVVDSADLVIRLFEEQE